MKTCIAYDSVHGNTEKIARAMGDSIGGEVLVVRAGEVKESESCDLFIVGGPTHAGRPTPPIGDLLKRIPDGALEGTSVAAFDTRVPKKWVRLFGFAAPKIAGKLKGKGGRVMAEPEGFFVEDTEGPLREGELERAAVWARAIADKMA